MPDELLHRLFGAPAIQAAFSGRASVQGMLDFEAALARVQARQGLIPASAAQAIADCCQADRFDLEQLSRDAQLSGNTAIPMLRQLKALVYAADTGAAAYVHYGATSQDAQDTGLVLQLRTALAALLPELEALCAACADLAGQHRATPLAGRTWLQHALPTTFGLKAAGWLDALERHIQRFAELRPRFFALQLGGAAGTLASLHPHGPAVAQALAQELDLANPGLPWHTQRDRIAELGTVLALLTGSLGKMARDWSLLMQSEAGEVYEPAIPGRGGSSSMPHKRNPVGAAVVLSAALRAPALASTLLSAMVQEHERGLGGWHAEWPALPELFDLTAGALAHSRQVVEGLEVNPEHMRSNIDSTQGLILAESVKMALAPQFGATEAHAYVEQACRKAAESGLHLRAVLEADERVQTVLDADVLTQIFDPSSYLGAADTFINAALTVHHSRKEQRTQPAEPSPHKAI